MATIRSQLTLNDGMSAVLKKITQALDTTLASFEQMQRASGEAVDTSAIEAARSALADASRTADDFAGGLERAAWQSDMLAEGCGRAAQQAEALAEASDTALGRGAAGMDGLLGKAQRLLAALGAAAGAQRLVSLSDDMTSTNARLALIVDDGGSVEALEEKIMASAQRSRAAYLDTASAIASMGANAGAAFSGNDELIAFLEQVNKQFAIGGASAQGQAAAMLQLTQAMAAGALRGEELNSILENAPGIARAIERYMGVAEGSIKQYAEQGLITADVVKNALFAAADETNAKFESMPRTWAQVWTNMQNSALVILEPLLAQINALANSEWVQGALDGVLGAFSLIVNIASDAFGMMMEFGSAVAENWGWIGPVVLGAAGAFAAVSVAQLASAAAQWAMNAAMSASPVTWITLGVGLLIGALGALCGWIARTTGLAQTGFGIVMGGINVVLQYWVNFGMGVANIALGIWNALKACCSNIGTAFQNTISGVQGWFYNLLSTALTVISGICAALNKLPFVEFDFSGITGRAEEYASKAAAAKANKGSYEDVGTAFNEGFGTFDAFGKGWAAEAFQSGAAWGDGISGKIGGLFDGFSYAPDTGGVPALDMSGALAYDPESLSPLAGTGGTLGHIADTTDTIARAVEVSGEELQYLRDIAERDAVNRYTTAEVKIDMTGMTNKIEGSADLDGVLSTLTDGFAAALLTAAEGVHA